VDQKKKIWKDGKTIQKQQNCDDILITWSVDKKKKAKRTEYILE
jgi:hypothetical protein